MNYEKLYGMTHVAKMLGVSRRTLYRMIEQRDLPRPLKIGKRSVYLKSDIESIFEKLRAQRTQEGVF